MDKKWTKEQIKTARTYLKENCDLYHCEECPFFSPDKSWEITHCLIKREIGIKPTNAYMSSLEYKNDFIHLIKQHEHDADEHTCKQTTPPHKGVAKVIDVVTAYLNNGTSSNTVVQRTDLDKYIISAISSDLAVRSEMGKKKYGYYLETFNGRNALQDAYEEILDFIMYIEQANTEHYDAYKYIMLESAINIARRLKRELDDTIKENNQE